VETSNPSSLSCFLDVLGRNTSAENIEYRSVKCRSMSRCALTLKGKTHFYRLPCTNSKSTDQSSLSPSIKMAFSTVPLVFLRILTSKGLCVLPRRAGFGLFVHGVLLVIVCRCIDISVIKEGHSPSGRNHHSKRANEEILHAPANRPSFPGVKILDSLCEIDDGIYITFQCEAGAHFNSDQFSDLRNIPKLITANSWRFPGYDEQQMESAHQIVFDGDPETVLRAILMLLTTRCSEAFSKRAARQRRNNKNSAYQTCP
jgi:hypothetical protein